jgi:hypothetical protein
VRIHKFVSRILAGTLLMLSFSFVGALLYAPRGAGQATGWAPVNGPFNGAIGSTTPSTGAFTALSASSTVSGTGFSTYLASPPAIGGTAAAAGTFTALKGTSETCGIIGTTSCVISLNGSTSGTATITAPAVAGTISNPVASSNSISMPEVTLAGNSCSQSGAGFFFVCINGGNQLTAGNSSNALIGAQFQSVNVPISGSFNTNGNVLIAGGAPTISSGFGTSPSVPSNNGSSAFRINVGTGGTATTGVIAMPTATTGWNVFCSDITTQNATVARTQQIGAGTSTTVTIGNFTDLGAAGAWAASDILACTAFAF